MSTFRAYALQYFYRNRPSTGAENSPSSVGYTPVLNDKQVDQKGVYWGEEPNVIEYLKTKRSIR